jgi:hypothetical protein
MIYIILVMEIITVSLILRNLALLKNICLFKLNVQFVSVNYRY